jgi:hypothetical protein
VSDLAPAARDMHIPDDAESSQPAGLALGHGIDGAHPLMHPKIGEAVEMVSVSHRYPLLAMWTYLRVPRRWPVLR